MMVLEGARIELEGRAEELLASYDAAKQSWTLQKAGDLWDSVRIAHNAGLTGRDRRVAVIDGGFDTAVGPLGKPNCSVLVSANPGRKETAHGTCVALLIHEIAPAAELLLYETADDDNVDFRNVVAALTTAGPRADVINVSLGAERLLSDIPDSERPSEHRAVTSHSCSLCDAARDAEAAGSLVCAAVGNSRDVVACPAAYTATVACGFVGSMETVDGDGMRISMPLPPTVDADHDTQAVLVGSLVVKQPAGVVGSSFATPLLSAFLAITEMESEVAKWQAVSRVTTAGYEWMFMKLWPTAERALAQCLSLIPEAHRHWDEDTRRPCATCSFFAAPWYANFGLTKIRLGLFDEALSILRVGRDIAPLHPDIAANHGFAALVSAKENEGDAHKKGNLFREAVDSYEAALRQVRSQEFEERRDEAAAALAGLSIPNASKQTN
jgi:hypothetical protein